MFSNAEPYLWPLSRLVPAHYVKVILPSVVIGYVLPTMIMFVPWTSQATTQTFEAVWWASPMITSLLTFVGGMLLKKLVPPPIKTPHAADEPKDLPYLKRIYFTTFTIGVALHLGVSFGVFLSSNPNISLSSVFIPNANAELETTSWSNSRVCTSHRMLGAATQFGISSASGEHMLSSKSCCTFTSCQFCYWTRSIIGGLLVLEGNANGSHQRSGQEVMN